MHRILHSRGSEHLILYLVTKTHVEKIPVIAVRELYRALELNPRAKPDLSTHCKDWRNRSHLILTKTGLAQSSEAMVSPILI